MARALPKPSAALAARAAALAPHEQELDAELDEAAEVCNGVSCCEAACVWVCGTLRPCRALPLPTGKPGLLAGRARFGTGLLPAAAACLVKRTCVGVCCPWLQEIKAAMREEFRAEDLAQFEIAADADFEGAVGGAAPAAGGLVAVKGGKTAAAAAVAANGRPSSGGKRDGGKRDGGRRDGGGKSPGGKAGGKHKAGGGGGGGGDGKRKKQKQ